jgi:ubiquinone/menaquinone biosynthesis C-methylase UbiE
MVDVTAFRSDRLPVEHFDRRFSDENVAFWVPIFVDAAEIGGGLDVLDVGCGTGGFAAAIAEASSANVVGCDVSERFIEHATQRPAPAHGTVEWAVGDAEYLPFAASSFDRVLLSLVLHQLRSPLGAVYQSFRVLRPGGVVLVRTIAPEDVADRVPERYTPAMAAADKARMPPIDEVVGWLETAGFTDVGVERHVRNKPLALDEEIESLLTEARSRYTFVSEDELATAVERMRADAAAAGASWIDPRPTYVITAKKPPERP